MFAKIQEKNIQARAKITGFLDKFQKLGLSEQCKSIRSGLTTLINNSDIFSSHLTSQLIPSATGKPYKVHPDDAEQIAVLKKISNILYNVETILASLEKIKLTEDMYTMSLVKHAPEVFKQSMKAMEQINEAMQLINNSSSSLQAIMGPQIKSLEPAYNYVLAQLHQFTPSGVLTEAELQLGNAIGSAVNLLPTKLKTEKDVTFKGMASAITNIPIYFTQLQSLIENESLSSYKNSSQSEEDYKHKLELRAQLLSKYLEKAANNQGMQQFKILKQFGKLATDVVNTAMPATKEAYNKAVEKLNQFKHELLPQMIAELESLEESLGLKSGTLVDPALKFADTYYGQLAETVNQLYDAAGVADESVAMGNKWHAHLGKKVLLGSGTHFDSGKVLEKDHDLTTLLDSTVIKTREQRQNVRIDEAKSRQHQAEECNKAAQAFYSKIKEVNTFRNDGQFSALSVEDKQELAFLYKQFQTYMAANNPELDRVIVDKLKLTQREVGQLSQGTPENSTYMQTLWGGLGTVATYSLLVAQKMSEGSSPILTIQENEFITLLNTEDKVLSSISKAISTEELRISLINDTKSHAKHSTYEQSSKQTLLEESAVFPELTKYQYIPGLSADELYHQTLIIENQHSEIVRAEKALNNFMEQLSTFSNPSELLSNLNLSDKEALRAEYKKFQPYLCLLGENNPAIRDLNIQVVTSLMNPSKANDENITISQVSGFKNEIENQLKALKDKRNNIITMFSLREAKARKNPGTEISLKPIGITSKNTLSDQASVLLSQLKESNSSASIEGFLHATLIPALKENLNEELINKLRLNGDLSQLKPYVENNEDTSQVKLYKNLINSFLHLGEAIKTYEQLGKDKGFFSIEALSFAKSIYTIGSAVGQLGKAVKTIQNNPVLANLAQSGLDTISPLKSNPLLQPYFANNESNAENSQIIDNIPETDVAPLQNLIDRFHKLQHQIDTSYPSLGLNELAIDPTTFGSTMADLIESVSNLKNYSSKNMAQFLSAVKKLQTSLNNTAVGGHELIIENIKNFRIQFHEAIIKPLDDAEYELGVKPGVLTDNVSEHFDTFYLRLLDRVVNDTIQNDLMLLVTKPVQDRIQNEITRLKELQQLEPKNAVEATEKIYNIQRTENKIEYLKVQLVHEPHQKLTQFKRLKFEDYVNNNISGLLNRDLGPYSDAFFKEIQPGLLSMNDEILNSISIEDDLGQKIAEAVLPRFERLMSKITDVENQDDDVVVLKGLYENFVDAYAQITKINEMEEVIKSELKGSLLFKQINRELHEFKNNISQFSKNYTHGDSLQEHQLECNQFKTRVDVYKNFINKENLATYEGLVQERSALVNRTDLSFLETQKLEYIKTYEPFILEFAKNHAESEISGEIKAFKDRANDYDKLIQIEKLNNHLVLKLNKPDAETNQSLAKIQIQQFATDLRAILMDKNIELPKEKLAKISARVEQEDLNALANKSNGNPIIDFFRNIVQRIVQVITGSKAPENSEKAIQKFHNFKKQIKDVVAGPNLKKEEPEVIPSQTSAHQL